MSRIHEAMKQAAEMAAKAHELPVVEGLTPMTVDEADGLSREPFPIEIGEHLRNRQVEAPEPLAPPVMSMPAPPPPVYVAPAAALTMPPSLSAPPISTPPAPPLPQVPASAPMAAAPPPAMTAATSMPVAPPPMAATLPPAARPSAPLPLHTDAPNGNGARELNRELNVDAALDAALARELPPLVPREPPPVPHVPLVPREPRRPLAPAIGTAAMRDQDEGGPVESKHFLDYLRMFYKRRVSAAVTFVIVVLGGAAYTWTSTPIFEARVQLMIESERPVVRVFKDETVEAAADKADYQETQNKILASRGLAAKVLDTLGLWSRTEFTGSDQPSGVRRLLIPVVNIGAKVVNRFSMTDWTIRKKDAPEEGETGDRSRVIDTFLDHLTIAPVRNSRLVDVKFQSPDPKLAADISNTLADEYIKQTREYKSKSSKESSDLLTGQLEEQRKTLMASEAALQRYREQTDTMSTAERDSALQTKLNELNTALTRAQADRRAKEQTFEQLKKAIGDPKALDIHPAITASPAVLAAKSDLMALQKREVEVTDNLGPRHPDLVGLREQIQRAESRVRDEQRKVIDTVEAELAVVRANEANLINQAETQKQGATSMRRKQGEYDALEREAASNRDVFESLLQRTKENGVSSEILASNIRVVDAADVPHTPISPQRVRDMSIAVVAGLAMSVLVAFAREYLDKRIKTPDEVKAQLGLPCIGLIPAITRDTPVLSNGVPALFSEAFRALRTSVLFASAEEGAHTLLITSTGPNEGKTLVAVNLAVSLAQTGRRVLIIDADLRRPTVHKLLGETQEPGMSGITEPGWQVESVIRGTYVENLSMIPAGALPHYPAELLASEAFKQVVKRLADVYDWVILDSPPVMAVTDAVLIGHLADGVVFVIGSEQTAGPTAVNALEKLHSGHARFLGAVLNKCKLEHNRHYYTHHYRPEYQEYYGVKDD